MNWEETIPLIAILYVVVSLFVLLRLQRLAPDRRRRANRIVGTIIVLVLLVGVVIIPHSRYWILGNIRGEKSVDGHHIGYWRYQIRNGRDYDRAIAYGALHKLGPEAKPAVPELIDRLKDPSWQTDNREHTNPVAGVLAKIGPGAKEAIPALVGSLAFERNSEHVHCADTLVVLGPDSIDAVIPQLTHPKNSVRFDAAYVLGKFGNQAKAAVPELVRLIADPEMRALPRQFGKKETLAWIAAVEALGNIGPDAKDAIPILVANLLETQSQPYAFEVWTALARIDGKNADAIMPCGQAAALGDAVSFETAARIFGGLGANDLHVRELAASILSRELETNWGRVLHWRAASPQFANTVRNTFVAAMMDPSASVSQYAAALYVATLFSSFKQKEETSFKQSDLEMACRLLEKAIAPSQTNVRIRARAVGALTMNGCVPGRPEFDMEPYVELRKTVPALIRALADSDAKVRHMAVMALAGRGVPAEYLGDLMDAFARYLVAPGDFSMDWAFMQDTVFRQAGPLIVRGAEKARPLVPILTRKLEEAPHLRLIILDILTQLGPNAQDALPTLHKLAMKDGAGGYALAIRAIEGKK